MSEAEGVKAFANEFLQQYYKQFEQDKTLMGHFYVLPPRRKHTTNVCSISRARSPLREIKSRVWLPSTNISGRYTLSRGEGELTQGLRFGKIKHVPASVDAQVNGVGNGAIIMVTGEVTVHLHIWNSVR
jgi:Nuclear transport factor 2 (NTF2) domain